MADFLLQNKRGGQFTVDTLGTLIKTENTREPIIITPLDGDVYIEPGKIPVADPAVTPILKQEESVPYGGETFSTPGVIGVRAVTGLVEVRVMSGPFASRGISKPGGTTGPAGPPGPGAEELITESATYYFSPTGSDVTGDGTVGLPWQSYRHGYEQVLEGRVILGADIIFQFADGDYSAFNPFTDIYSYLFPFGYTGPFGGPVWVNTVRAYSGGKFRIQAENPGQVTLGPTAVDNSENVEIDGVVGGGIAVSTSSKVSLTNCIFNTRVPGEGISGFWIVPSIYIQSSEMVGIDTCLISGSPFGVLAFACSVVTVSNSRIFGCRTAMRSTHCSGASARWVYDADPVNPLPDIAEITDTGGGTARVHLDPAGTQFTDLEKAYGLIIRLTGSSASSNNGSWVATAYGYDGGSGRYYVDIERSSGSFTTRPAGGGNISVGNLEYGVLADYNATAYYFPENSLVRCELGETGTNAGGQIET